MSKELIPLIEVLLVREMMQSVKETGSETPIYTFDYRWPAKEA